MFYKKFLFSCFFTGNMNEHKEQRERQQRKPDLNNILNDKIDPVHKIRRRALRSVPNKT